METYPDFPTSYLKLSPDLEDLSCDRPSDGSFSCTVNIDYFNNFSNGKYNLGRLIIYYHYNYLGAFQTFYEVPPLKSFYQKKVKVKILK